jgi:hypothetical protein
MLPLARRALRTPTSPRTHTLSPTGIGAWTATAEALGPRGFGGKLAVQQCCCASNGGARAGAGAFVAGVFAADFAAELAAVILAAASAAGAAALTLETAPLIAHARIATFWKAGFSVPPSSPRPRALSTLRSMPDWPPSTASLAATNACSVLCGALPLFGTRSQSEDAAPGTPSPCSRVSWSFLGPALTALERRGPGLRPRPARRALRPTSSLLWALQQR